MQSTDGSSQVLTDDQIADNIIGVIFAAQDTTASVLTWIIKYLRDHPSFLEAVTVIKQTKSIMFIRHYMASHTNIIQ